jgi:hypothetical protein
MPGLVSITSAPATSALTTLANVKSELPQVVGSGDDGYLMRQIDAASAIITRHCGRPLGRMTVTETFRYGWQPGFGPTAQQVAPYGTPLNVQMKPLLLTYYSPANAGVSAVAVSSISENGGDPLTVGTDYEADLDAGLLWRLTASGNSVVRSWWNVPQVVVTYSAGYQLPGDSPVGGVPALPAEVESVCISLVSAAYIGRGFDRSVVMDWTEGVGRTQYSPNRGLSAMLLDDEAKEMLAPYVLREF